MDERYCDLMTDPDVISAIQRFKLAPVEAGQVLVEKDQSGSIMESVLLDTVAEMGEVLGKKVLLQVFQQVHLPPNLPRMILGDVKVQKFLADPKFRHELQGYL